MVRQKTQIMGTYAILFLPRLINPTELQSPINCDWLVYQDKTHLCIL